MHLAASNSLALASALKGRNVIAQGAALGINSKTTQALKGREIPLLIPNIALVEVHLIASQKLSEFILKRDLSMMFALVTDVAAQVI